MKPNIYQCQYRQMTEITYRTIAGDALRSWDKVWQVRDVKQTIMEALLRAAPPQHGENGDAAESDRLLTRGLVPKIIDYLDQDAY